MSSKVELHTRVLDELIRQREIWGEQNHPWHPTEVDDTNLVTWTGRGVLTADNAKALVGIFAEEGTLTYADILMEEVIEALEETDPGKIVEELIQVAAVAIAAADSIQRNGR